MISVRRRYLVAMGLLPAGLSGACNRETTSPVSTTQAGDVALPTQTEPVSPRTPKADAGPVLDASLVTHVSANPERTERHDAGGGGWHVVTKAEPASSVLRRPEPPRPEPPLPSCPSGRFCVHAPSNVDRAAPAPFSECASTASKTDVGAPPSFEPTHIQSFDPALTRSERATIPDACCYTWYEPCPGGRPLRVGDRILRAAPIGRGDWGANVEPASRAIDAATRAELTAYWLDQAASEHASVASFNRFALQLLALGAPPDMVTATLDAARDEVRHASLCYGLAARYSGRKVGPGKLDLPLGLLPVDPVTVAIETLRDGCLGESVAAELAREAADRACDPEVATSLARIAADEENHAELAWRALAWLAAEYGEPVRVAIDAFAAELAGEHDPTSGGGEAVRRDAEGDAASSHGVLGGRRQLALRLAVIREIVQPCLEALAVERAA